MEELKKLILKPISGEWGDEGEKVKVIRSTNFTNLGVLDFKNLVLRDITQKKIEQKKLEKGDIIIEKSGGSPTQPVGRVVYFEEDGLFMCNNFTSVLRPKKEKVIPKYLHYQLFASHKFGLTNTFQNKTTGIINLQLTRYIEKLRIPLPPLETQKRIAQILDDAAALRDKTAQLLKEYDLLAQSIFLDVFGDPVVNPKGFQVSKIGDIITFLTSGSRGWAKYYSNQGAVFLRIQNIGYNKLKLNDLTYVQAANSGESIRTKVQPGDVILSITADLGRTAVIPKGFPNANINQHLALLRLKRNFNPEYISAFIASKGGQHQFFRLDKGGVKAGLNFSDIKSYKLFIPPINLQNQFAEKIALIEQQKALAKQELKESENLFNCLLQKAFKGELV